MVFYLVPPKGAVGLGRLESICNVRFGFLQNLGDVTDLDDFKRLVSVDRYVENSECLMENNQYDKLGHFAVRLLSARCERLRSVVDTGEQRLFRFRLQLMDTAELADTLQQVVAGVRHLRAVQPAGPCRPYLDSLLSLASAAGHHLAEHGDAVTDDCDEPVVRVPFELVTPLVAVRAVSLSAGHALVRCRQTRAALACLFDAGLRVLAPPPAAEPRLQPLLERLQARLERRPSAAAATALTLDALERAAPLLPPCMAALHEELLRRHRLPHRDRFSFSLFLKDAGLPLEENVRLWSREYSLPAADGSACSHTWTHSQKRYQYSLRHMYGLEGRRVGYDSHRCQSLQERSGESLSSCGGCPFVGFDESALRRLLTGAGRLSAAEAAPLLVADDPPAVRCRRYQRRLVARCLRHHRPDGPPPPPGPHHGAQNQDHGVQSQDHSVQNQDHGAQNQDHGVQNQDHGVQNQDHGGQNQDHGVQSLHHGVQSPHHGVEKQDHGVQSQDHGVQSPQHGVLSPQHGAQGQDHDARDHGVQGRHDRSFSKPSEFFRGVFEIFVRQGGCT